jgi:hypothetical protein
MVHFLAASLLVQAFLLPPLNAPSRSLLINQRMQVQMTTERGGEEKALEKSDADVRHKTPADSPSSSDHKCTPPMTMTASRGKRSLEDKIADGAFLVFYFSATSRSRSRPRLHSCTS